MNKPYPASRLRSLVFSFPIIAGGLLLASSVCRADDAPRVGTAEELLAAALKAGAGDSLVLEHKLISTADPTVLSLTDLAGDITVRIVGATDFVACSPRLPDDMEMECIDPVPFTTADGIKGDDQRLNPLYPLYASGLVDRFPGPERQTLRPLPVPFDHDKTGEPLGLRVLGEGRGWQHAHNHLRHTRDHDGFILWVAEYRLQDGSKWITWEDLPMTRANCPTFRPRLSVIDSQNPATHLLKLVTLQVASAKEMMVKDKADSPDPRRWPLQPKRFRSRYTPHRTLTAEGNILPLSAVQEAILDVRIDVEGGIEGFKPGEDFVIQLPPVIIDVDEEKDEGRVLNPFGSDGVAEHLRKLRKNRVFLIGTPGKTIIPAIEATGVRNLDFGWITVSPVKRNARDDRMVTAGRETDIRFFGCVVDAVDFSPAGVMTLLGGQTPGLPSQRGEPQRGAWVEFYDGYFGGTEGPGFSYANQKLPYHAIPRLIFARSILDSSNDGISMYGQGMLLVESCYFYGGGGRWNVKSGNYQHRDILGQFIPMGVDLMAAAYYNNIVSMGRNLVGVNLAQRGNGSLLMYQPSCDYASEYVGNILENNGRQRGITGMHDLRCPPSRKIGTSWGYGMHIAENTIFERPDHISGGWSYPQTDFGGFSCPIDTTVGTNNVVPFFRALMDVAGFQRTVNWLPEATQGWEARWLTITNRTPGPRGKVKDNQVLQGAKSGAEVTIYNQETVGLGELNVLVREIKGKFKPGETIMCGENKLGEFGGLSETFAFNGDRTVYPSAAEAFAKMPHITGSFEKGYTLDYSETTYGGTGREGYVSASDFEVSRKLRRFSVDGKTGGPGIPYHGEYLERFLELPANFNKDLLGYGRPDSGYGDDWYEQWAPKPFKLKGTFDDPWTPMPGSDTVAEKDLVINTRIADLGTGTLAEEVATDGSLWRLEILNDGTHRPRFTVLDESGQVLYQITSARSIEANGHLLVGVSTQHRSYGQEYGNAQTLWMRWIWDHFERAKRTSDLLLTVAISHITPQTQTPVEGETFIWVDTTDHNRPKTRGKTGWTYLQGDLSEALSGFLVGLAREEGTYKSRFMGTNTLPVKTFRIYGAPNPRVFSPNAKPREGDYVIYARSDANAFNYMGAACARFEKGQWEMSSRLPYTMGNVLHGDVRCYIRVDGRESIREADWIWSNLQPDLLAVTYGVQAEPAAERRRSRITPVKPGTTDLSCGFQVLKPEHVDVYYLSPNARGRELLILNENYTVENLGVGKDGPTAKVVLKTPRLKAVGDRIHIAPAIPPAAEDDYGWDHPLPRGHVRLGDSASSPFTGTVNYFEARRQKGVYLHKQAIEVPATGVQHRFARRPSDPKTGRRDTPLLPAADVWATADK